MMAHALNLTLKLKQDPQSRQALQELKAAFATTVQPAIDQVLRKSKLVHFARVVVIDDLYIQVLTEYDGEQQAYTNFFLKELPTIFQTVFALAEGAPSWDKLSKPDEFYKFSRDKNLPGLGEGIDDPGLHKKKSDGYLFSAYGEKMVKELLPKS
jgi:hypothetical protein